MSCTNSTRIICLVILQSHHAYPPLDSFSSSLDWSPNKKYLLSEKLKFFLLCLFCNQKRPSWYSYTPYILYHYFKIVVIRSLEKKTPWLLKGLNVEMANGEWWIILKVNFQENLFSCFWDMTSRVRKSILFLFQKLPFSNVKQVQNRWTLEVSVLECYVICSEYELVGLSLRVH